MGWFLTRNTKRRRRPPRRSIGLAAAVWDSGRTLAGLKVLGAIGIGVFLVVGWRLAETGLTRYADRAYDQPITADRVVLMDAPAWMSQAVRLRLRSLASRHVRPNVFDSGQGLRIAVLALQQDPWVRQVNQVRRLAGGLVHVRADYREPVALIEALGGYHLVDREGVSLPGLYFSHQVDRLGLAVITGVGAPPPKTGQIWAGPDAQAALSLVGLLADEPYVDQIKEFDVAYPYVRGRGLALRTNQGAVIWGLPPGLEQTIEPPAGVKIGRLRYTARMMNGRIDAGGKIVHLYGEAIQTSLPASPTRPSSYNPGC